MRWIPIAVHVVSGHRAFHRTALTQFADKHLVTQRGRGDTFLPGVKSSDNLIVVFEKPKS